MISLKKKLLGINKKSNEEYVFSVRSGKYKIEFGTLENISNQSLEN